MRWLTFVILGYIMLGLQAGLATHLRIGPAQPNLVLLIAIFIAIWAPRDAALLACFILGACQDLLTAQPLGLCALTYGLVGMFTVSTQQIVYRGHPLTHFSLALFGGLLGGFIQLIHGWIGVKAPSQWWNVMTLFYSALYTALLAPIFLGVLGKMKRSFAFQSSRSKIRI